MLQIISIYKGTDFAPLFVTVTTAEQRLLGYIYVKLLEWHLFILVIQRSQLTTYNQSLPVRIQHGCA